jgi:hypothetical protein
LGKYKGLRTPRYFALLLSLVCLSASVLAGDKKPNSPPVMADVTERGRALYEYDQAAWHGTDAVLATHPPKEFRPHYIAHKADERWTVAFGVLNAQRDRFVIKYEATQGATLQEFTAKTFDPPLEDTGFYVAAAKAIDTALGDFRGERRPYNVAILPTLSGQFYLYVYPAQTQNGIYPLGGDVRYLIAADGGSIVEKRQLHKTILETPAVPKDAVRLAGFHTHVLSDVPEDTDVFHVLTRQPPQPEYIGTMRKDLYTIDTDGTIHKGKM